MTNRFAFRFENGGYMKKGKVYTSPITPQLAAQITLNDIILDEDVDEQYFLTKAQNDKFAYLKGSKRIPRIDKNTGFEYMYSEGAMAYPDSYTNPGRTMLTSEGTVNRSTHVIEDRKTGKLRLLTPGECERLNQFPDNWTNTMIDKRRYFMMGNALVTGIIKKLGAAIEQYIEKED